MPEVNLQFKQVDLNFEKSFGEDDLEEDDLEPKKAEEDDNDMQDKSIPDTENLGNFVDPEKASNVDIDKVIGLVGIEDFNDSDAEIVETCRGSFDTEIGKKYIGYLKGFLETDERLSRRNKQIILLIRQHF